MTTLQKNKTLLIKPTKQRKFTLAARLASFNPKKHGGETMAVKLVGLEKLYR